MALKPFPPIGARPGWRACLILLGCGAGLVTALTSPRRDHARADNVTVAVPPLRRFDALTRLGTNPTSPPAIAVPTDDPALAPEVEAVERAFYAFLALEEGDVRGDAAQLGRVEADVAAIAKARLPLDHVLRTEAAFRVLRHASEATRAESEALARLVAPLTFDEAREMLPEHRRGRDNVGCTLYEYCRELPEGDRRNARVARARLLVPREPCRTRQWDSDRNVEALLRTTAESFPGETGRTFAFLQARIEDLDEVPGDRGPSMNVLHVAWAIGQQSPDALPSFRQTVHDMLGSFEKGAPRRWLALDAYLAAGAPAPPADLSRTIAAGGSDRRWALGWLRNPSVRRGADGRDDYLPNAPVAQRLVDAVLDVARTTDDDVDLALAFDALVAWSTPGMADILEARAKTSSWRVAASALRRMRDEEQPAWSRLHDAFARFVCDGEEGQLAAAHLLRLGDDQLDEEVAACLSRTGDGWPLGFAVVRAIERDPASYPRSRAVLRSGQVRFRSASDDDYVRAAIDSDPSAKRSRAKTTAE